MQLQIAQKKETELQIRPNGGNALFSGVSLRKKQLLFLFLLKSDAAKFLAVFLFNSVL